MPVSFSPEMKQICLSCLVFLKTPNRHADDFGVFNATQTCLSCLVFNTHMRCYVVY